MLGRLVTRPSSSNCHHIVRYCTFRSRKSRLANARACQFGRLAWSLYSSSMHSLPSPMNAVCSSPDRGNVDVSENKNPWTCETCSTTFPPSREPKAHCDICVSATSLLRSSVLCRSAGILESLLCTVHYISSRSTTQKRFGSGPQLSGSSESCRMLFFNGLCVLTGHSSSLAISEIKIKHLQQSHPPNHLH